MVELETGTRTGELGELETKTYFKGEELMGGVLRRPTLVEVEVSGPSSPTWPALCRPPAWPRTFTAGHTQHPRQPHMSPQVLVH